MTLRNVCSENVLLGKRLYVDFPTLLGAISSVYILTHVILYKSILYL